MANSKSKKTKEENLFLKEVGVKYYFKRAFLQTINKYAHFIRYCVGSFGSAIACFFLLKSHFNQPLGTSLLWSIACLFGCFLIVLIYFIIVNALIYLKNKMTESYWASVLEFLVSQNSLIQIMLDSKETTDETMMKFLRDFCDGLKKLFDKLTESQCGVSIKIPIDTDPKTDLYNKSVKNLCRDSFHREREMSAYDKVDHRIAANTPFFYIVNKIDVPPKRRKNMSKWHYLNKDIPADEHYDNTSTEVYENGILPYKSELVIPILKHYSDKVEILTLGGFLCIDCAETNKFIHLEYALILLRGLSEQLFVLLTRLKIDESTTTEK